MKRQRKLKQYIFGDLYGNTFSYLCYTQKYAIELFEAENGKEWYTIKKVLKKLLSCPNCQQPMRFIDQEIYDGENYDKWNCDACSHIIVLDYRGAE